MAKEPDNDFYHLELFLQERLKTILPNINEKLMLSSVLIYYVDTIYDFYNQNPSNQILKNLLHIIEHYHKYWYNMMTKYESNETQDLLNKVKLRLLKNGKDVKVNQSLVTNSAESQRYFMTVIRCLIQCGRTNPKDKYIVFCKAVRFVDLCFYLSMKFYQTISRDDSFTKKQVYQFIDESNEDFQVDPLFILNQPFFTELKNAWFNTYLPCEELEYLDLYDIIRYYALTKHGIIKTQKSNFKPKKRSKNKKIKSYPNFPIQSFNPPEIIYPQVPDYIPPQPPKQKEKRIFIRRRNIPVKLLSSNEIIKESEATFTQGIDLNVFISNREEIGNDICRYLCEYFNRQLRTINDISGKKYKVKKWMIERVDDMRDIFIIECWFIDKSTNQRILFAHFTFHLNNPLVSIKEGVAHVKFNPEFSSELILFQFDVDGDYCSELLVIQVGDDEMVRSVCKGYVSMFEQMSKNVYNGHCLFNRYIKRWDFYEGHYDYILESRRYRFDFDMNTYILI